MKSAIVLAAGKGTRMKSSLNKVMHKISNKPMIGHIIDQLKKADVDRIVVVVGHGSESVKEYLGDRVEYALQEPQLGTGHAVMQASVLSSCEGDTIILCGDGPLIQKETIEKAFIANQEKDLTILSAILEDGASYGRIVKDQANGIEKVVEAKDCTNEQLLINEVNTGIFVIKTQKLFQGLKKLNNNNAQQEYYLTDLVEIFNQESWKTNVLSVENVDETMGVNDRVDLAKAQKLMFAYTNKKHMLNGVTIIDPNTTYIDCDVEIEKDTIIHPNVTIQGNSYIQEGVEILSNSFIKNSKIHKGVLIDSSKIVDSEIKENSVIGPMSHLRDHCIIGKNCRIGNFVELKNTKFGDGSKSAHLTYLGNSEFGKNINVGCGVITVNYDGKNKYKTVVRDGAFIGSNCNLIAPITIGENALVAAGSTITEDIQDNDMGIARCKQVNKLGYGIKYKESKKKED